MSLSRASVFKESHDSFRNAQRFAAVLTVLRTVPAQELGDGRSSRFSHHGRSIKDKFDSRYCMGRAPIKRAVMTENKKFTHDMFVQEGFAQLRPPTAAYERRYSSTLAGKILRDLDVRSGGAVVLKLCNRSRGAGVVVASRRSGNGGRPSWRSKRQFHSF
eukprot:g1869.t1